MDPVVENDLSIDASLESSIEIVREQLTVLGVYLARPIVQQQLLMLVLVIVVAWTIPATLRYWLRRQARAERASPSWRTRMQAAYLIMAPLLALALIQGVIWLFQRAGTPVGILTESRTLLWIWLAYRTVLMLLYARYGPAFGPFHHRILLPVFLLYLGVRISENFVNIRLLSDFSLFTLFGTTVTVERLFMAFAVLYGFVVAAWVLALAIRQTLGMRDTIDPGVTESIVTVSRYVVVGIGLLIALYLLGVNLSTLALIGGGLSIGVGLGLQNIVANFISGLVLLFEQAVLPGDVIDMNGRIGTVEQVNIRSTTVRTLDNIEVVVPNEAFMTNEVTTYTKTDNRIRLLLPLGVAYGSDPPQVRRVASAAATRHGLVLAQPAPDLFFKGFGDSSLDFELAVWIDQPDRAKRISSDLYYMLWSAFADHGIEIPFPQRDLHLRHGWEQLAPAASSEAGEAHA